MTSPVAPVEPSETVEPLDPYRRRPGRAALLSAILPGLGQLYAGHPIRGAIIWLVVVAMATLTVTSAVVLSATATAIIFLVLVLIPVFAVADAAYLAWCAPEPYERRWYQHWATYAFIVMVVGFMVLPIIQRAVDEIPRDPRWAALAAKLR